MHVQRHESPNTQQGDLLLEDSTFGFPPGKRPGCVSNVPTAVQQHQVQPQ